MTSWLCACAGLKEHFPAGVVQERILESKAVKQISSADWKHHFGYAAMTMQLTSELLRARIPNLQWAPPIGSQAAAAEACCASLVCKLSLSVDSAQHVSLSIIASQGADSNTRKMQPTAPAPSHTQAASTSAWHDLSWPTPTASEGIELLLPRLMVVLRLYSQPQRRQRWLDECNGLRSFLQKICCTLLLDYVSNPQLDMKKVVQLAFPEVLRELAEQTSADSKDAAIWQLGTLLMQQVVSDPKILQHGYLPVLCADFDMQADSRAMWMIFGKPLHNTETSCCCPSLLASCTASNGNHAASQHHAHQPATQLVCKQQMSLVLGHAIV